MGNDARSPAKSIARVLSYRINQELNRPARSAPPFSQENPYRQNGSGAPAAKPAAQPVPATPWDGHLRSLLGARRWDQYATSGRRRDIARLLTAAHADGHDIDALLSRAVNRRDWEDDQWSPSRNVGGVLHHRVKALIATGEFQAASISGELPSQVARAVAHAAAPAAAPDGTARPPPGSQAPPPRPTRQRTDRGRG